MEFLKDFDNKSYINQELVVTWLSELFIPYLSNYGFTPYSGNKKFKRETKLYKQIINIDFANYQFVAYSPTITLNHVDKILEKQFQKFWTSIGKMYQMKFTFWTRACSPKNNMGLIDELGYHRFPSITNHETAVETFEKFKLFFDNELYKSLVELENPKSYIEVAGLNSYWNKTAKRTKEHFWFWTTSNDFSDEYKKYYYLKMYFPELLEQRRLQYFNSYKENDWELTDERIRIHDEIFDQIKLLRDF